MDAHTEVLMLELGDLPVNTICPRISDNEQVIDMNMGIDMEVKLM